MNIATMHVGVKQELDKTSALELPAFEPEEIDFWLNNAIRKFVKTRYSGVNVKRESFEQTQKRIDDLKPLIVEYIAYMEELDDANFLTADTSIPNSWSFLSGFSWPTDHWFTLSEATYIGPTGGSTVRTGITECTLDELEQRLIDPFSEHILHYGTAKPLRIFTDNSIELITDGNYSINNYFLTYLRKPAEVQVTATAVDCDLPEHTHDEIVKMAANMMLENIEQPRYQTHMNEVNTME